MSKKNFLIISILTVLLASVSLTKAQEKPSEKNDMQTMMHHDDMQKCMGQIAADSTMRMQMMDKMMEKCQGDKEAMMKMCKKMMDNPEMHKMMMDSKEMMKHDMMKDSTKTMN